MSGACAMSMEHELELVRRYELEPEPKFMWEPMKTRSGSSSKIVSGPAWILDWNCVYEI